VTAATVKAPTRLTDAARELLHSLIHHVGSEPWWSVVGETARRNEAIHQLEDLRLIDIDRDTHRCRPTSRGVSSNRLALRSGWRPRP
jgi:hypothetical protein